MPTVQVTLQNGQKWLVSPWEIVLSLGHVATMQAVEIGEEVLALVTRIQRVGVDPELWEMSYTLQELEERIGQREAEKLAKAQLKVRIQALRAEVQKNYDAWFVKIGRRDGFHCQHCKTTYELEIDHIIPLSKWGTNDLENLQLLCDPCNGKKSNRE